MPTAEIDHLLGRVLTVETILAELVSTINARGGIGIALVMLEKVRAFAVEVDDPFGPSASLGDGVLESLSSMEELLCRSLGDGHAPQIPALIEKRKAQ